MHSIDNPPKSQKPSKENIVSKRQGQAVSHKRGGVSSKKRDKTKRTSKRHDQADHIQARAIRENSPPGVRNWIQTLPREKPQSANKVARRKQPENIPSNLSVSPDATVSEYTVAASMGTETVKTAKSQLTFGQYRKWLEDRNASGKRQDWKTAEIRQESLQLSTSESTPESVQKLVSVAKQFVEDYERSEEIPEDDAILHSLVEDFHRKLCESLWENGFGSINEPDFQMDLDNAASRNEAFFQRTVMMHSTDHWRLNDTFVCETEQRWTAPRKTDPWRLSVKDISQLKGTLTCQPDLAFYFREDALKDDESSLGTLPENLDLAICPYEKTGGECFPFLFIEVKGPNGGLDTAELDGLHAASRALYNMLVCMRKVKKTKSFYKDARTFSIIADHTSFKAYIHRGSWLEKSEKIQFTRDLIRSGVGYKKNEINSVVRTIITGYVSTTLLPLLKETYEALSNIGSARRAPIDENLGSAWTQFCREFEKDNQVQKRRTTKRKANAAPASSAKSPRTLNANVESQLTQSSNASFGMGSLGVT